MGTHNYTPWSYLPHFQNTVSTPAGYCPLAVTLILSVYYRELSDVDGDGCLDAAEFALAMHLVQHYMQGVSLPPSLPFPLVQCHEVVLRPHLPVASWEHVMKCKKVFEAFHKDLVKGVLSGESPYTVRGKHQGVQPGGRNIRGSNQGAETPGDPTRGPNQGAETPGGNREGINHFEMMQVTLCTISSPRQTSRRTSYVMCGESVCSSLRPITCTH